MTLRRLFGQGLDRVVIESMIGVVRHGDYVVPRTEGERFLAECGLGDPSRFFPPLPPVPVQEGETRLLEERPLYAVSEVRVPSPFPDASPPNDFISVRRFRTHQKPRGKVLVLHGAMVRSRWPWDGLARRLAERSIEALVPSLPDHFERTRPGEHSGQYLIGGHLQRGLEVIRQGVTDVRALVRWLRQEAGVPVGLIGCSMGGLIGGWAIALEPLDFAVLVEPAVQLAPIVFETRLGYVVRRSLGRAGWSETEMRQWLQALSPASAQPLLPPERLLLVVPEYDGLVPPHSVERAWERWGRPPLLRYPAGHISIYFQRRPWQDILAFVERWCEDRGGQRETGDRKEDDEA